MLLDQNVELKTSVRELSGLFHTDSTDKSEVYPTLDAMATLFLSHNGYPPTRWFRLSNTAERMRHLTYKMQRMHHLDKHLLTQIFDESNGISTDNRQWSQKPAFRTVMRQGLTMEYR